MFLGMTRSDQLLKVRVLKSIDVESIALRSRECGEVQITNECRERRVDGADDDMSAILTQIHVSKQQFILIKFRRYATELCEEQRGKSDENDDIEDSEVSTNVRCKGRGGMNSNLESIIEELREWYHSNGDLCRTSTHRTRFKMKGPEERESSRANVSSVAGWTKSKTRSGETMFQQGTRVNVQVEDICMFERPDR